MSTDLTPFDFDGQQVRTARPFDDEPWFVVADVCRILGLSNPSAAIARLDGDDLSSTEVIDSMGRSQLSNITNESGLYGLIFLSRKPEAKRFKRWVTSEVLPAIRRGSLTALSRFPVPTTFAEALELAAKQAREIDAATQRVAELEPAAEAWDHLADTGTTLDVGAAAKKLREDGIAMGRTRLYAYLRTIGWVFAYGTQPKQSAVDAGWLTVDWGKPYVNERTGETEQGDAKTRVTAKGLAELRKRLAARAGEAS